MPRATLSASIAMPLVPLPPQSAHYSWDDLVEIMARLRMGCPWDREQTHRTLVPYLIEETYEVVEAIEISQLDGALRRARRLAPPSGLPRPARHGGRKVRHRRRRRRALEQDGATPSRTSSATPSIEDVDAQWRNWERLKALEKTGRQRHSRLDGIPKHLGALQRGQRMQEKAARVGFDWPDVYGVLDKLAEELARTGRSAAPPSQDDPHVREELGDVFFTLVNLSRALGIDAETAMREANEKFYRRFAFMEERAAAGGKSLSDLSLDELEELWQLAKA